MSACPSTSLHQAGSTAQDISGGMSAVRILAAGVDSLYASVRADLRHGVVAALEATRAMPGDDPKVISLREEDGNLLLRPHGWRGYPFWLSCPRFELYLGAAKPFPPTYIALHSSYIHTVGVEAAVAYLIDELGVILDGEVTPAPSRVDVYADVQGWQPQAGDFGRFACRGTRRRLYEQPRELHGVGNALSGFTFGRGAIVARIYNKTLEMSARGSGWQELLWIDRDPTMPVWRVEFQFRRKALTSFGITSMPALLKHRQGLWDYGCRWLSLRIDNGDVNRSRWPEALEWRELRGAQIGSPTSALIRQRLRAADERRLVSGFLGYVSSLAAANGAEDVRQAIQRTMPMATAYLRERGVLFENVVRRKRALRSTTSGAATPAARVL